MQRAIILCKLNKSLLKSYKSAGIYRQKSLYPLKFVIIPWLLVLARSQSYLQFMEKNKAAIVPCLSKFIALELI